MNSEKISGYLLDLMPNLKKEVRFFLGVSMMIILHYIVLRFVKVREIVQ